MGPDFVKEIFEEIGKAVAIIVVSALILGVGFGLGIAWLISRFF